MSLTGSVIKNRTISTLGKMTLYIPPELNSQKKFISANTKIENLLINLNELKLKTIT